MFLILSKNILATIECFLFIISYRKIGGLQNYSFHNQGSYNTTKREIDMEHKKERARIGQGKRQKGNNDTVTPQI